MRARMQRWVACVGALLVHASCATSEADTVSTPARRATHWIVAADLSASRRPAELDAAKQLVAGLNKVLANGDKISMIHVFERGLAEGGPPWMWEVPPAQSRGAPSPSDINELERAERALRAQLTVFFDPNVAGKLNATDLFATFHRAADIARADSTRRPVLIVLSDMLNATRELNMERQVPDSGWALERQREGRLPELTGVCVAAIGPDVAAAQSARMRAFWRTYFRASGASLADANYVNWMPDPSGIRC